MSGDESRIEEMWTAIVVLQDGSDQHSSQQIKRTSSQSGRALAEAAVRKLYGANLKLITSMPKIW